MSAAFIPLLEFKHCKDKQKSRNQLNDFGIIFRNMLKNIFEGITTSSKKIFFRQNGHKNLVTFVNLCNLKKINNLQRYNSVTSC